MTINIDKIDKSDAPKEVKEVYKRVKQFKLDNDSRKDWERIRTRCWNAAYPLDPDKEDSIWTKKEREAMVKRDQIPIQINDLARDIQGSSALITSKSPGLMFVPIGSSDLYVAELFKRGWDYVINGNDGQILFYDFIKEKAIGALAVIEAKHDPSMGIFGKIMLQCVDPTTYYFDPESKKRDHSDVNFGKAHLVSKDYAKETYEDLTDADLEFSPLPIDEEDSENVPDGKTGKDNYAEDTGDKEGPDEDKDENVWEIEDWEIKKEREIWVMVPDDQQAYGYTRKVYKSYAEIEADGWTLDKDKKTATDTMNVAALVWKRLVTKRIQRIIIGKKLVSETVNPLSIDAEGSPVLPVITLIEDRTLSGYPTGKTPRALELNRMANKRRMQSIYVVSKNMDATKILPQGCKYVEDEKHGDFIEVAKDAAFAPTQLGPVNSSAELINLMQIDKQSIHDEYQINDIIQGKIPEGQSNMAHRNVLALTEMVGVISSPGVVGFESSLVRLGKAVAALMLMVWPRKMWERLIEPDEMGSWLPDKEKNVDPLSGKPIDPQMMQQMPQEQQQQREQQISEKIKARWIEALDKLTGEGGKVKTDLIDIDVKIVAGSTQPTNRTAKRGEALDLVKAGVYDTRAYLDYVDDPKKDEIAERIERQRQEELEAMRQGEEIKKSKKA
jgi:hypothetical protein